METYNEDKETVNFKFNSTQTNITSMESLNMLILKTLEAEELDKSFLREVRLEFLDTYESIKFIRNLSSPDRKRAKDLKRWDNPYSKTRKEDPNGRIEVDLTNPHILEDMDFFREAAIRFKETGVYTHLYPDSNPYSEYSLFWKEEARRCREGLVRPSDGEWITGYHYFYLNYTVIQLTEMDKNMQVSTRTENFPHLYDGDYIFFHYLEKARRMGKHTATLKKRGAGFEQPIDEEVLTPKGFKKISDIKVGDNLISQQGHPTKVLEVIPQGLKDIYELTLKDGRKVQCGLNHLWTVFNTKNKIMTVTTKYLIDNGLKTNYTNSSKNGYKYHLPLNEDVYFDYDDELIISPYTMGVMLGDGTISSKGLRLSSNDVEIIDLLKKENPDIKIKKLSENFRYSLISKEKGFNRLSREFKKLGLMDISCQDKFIPEIYKYSSIENRLEIIKGLLDTDGTSSPNGSVRFTNTSERLVDDLAWILRSLGYIVRKSETNQKDNVSKFPNGYSSIQKKCWVLNIITEDNLFKLDRKNKNIKAKQYFHKKIAIKSIKKLNIQKECKCFIVGNSDNLYLTRDFIVTHNSFKGGSKLARNFILGETWSSRKKTTSFAIAEEKEYLIKDGVLNKFLDTANFCAIHTPFPRVRELKDSINEMQWTMGYRDKTTNKPHGTLNSVIGVTLKNDPNRARGKRGILIEWEEVGSFNNFLKSWTIARPSVEQDGVTFGLMNAYGCLTAGNKVWDNNGKLINIEDTYNLQKNGIVGYDGKSIYKEKIGWYREPHVKDCYRIYTSGNNYIECSDDHPILSTSPKWRKIKNGKTIGKIVTFTEASKIKVGDQLLMADKVDIFGKKRVKDARLIGLMIGDGNISSNNIPQLSCGDDEVYNYVKSKYDTKIYKEFTTKKGNVFRAVGIKNKDDIFKDAGIYGNVGLNKTLPLNIDEYDKVSLSELIGGYYDADGNVKYRKDQDRVIIVLTSISENLLNEVKFQLIKFGIHGIVQKEFRKKGYKPNCYIYRLYISNKTDVIRFHKNISFLCKHKQEILNKVTEYVNPIDRSRPIGFFQLNPDNNKGLFFKDKEYMTNLYQESVTKVEYVGKKTVYNLHTCHTNTYIGNGFITKQTGGEEGKGFEGLEEIFYSPKGYGVLPMYNVFDRNTDEKSKKCAFFFPQYLNAKNFYDKNGNSDVIGALIQIICKRINIKYNTLDPNAIVQEKAERPITPQEAIMRTEGSAFPTGVLKELLESIKPNYTQFISEHYVGELVEGKNGVEWIPKPSLQPLRSFPTKDISKAEGAIEIFEMPKYEIRGSNTRYIRPFRYIAGCDPVDNDYTKNGSLASIFVFDTWTDRIVAEYTGRPVLASEFYDKCILLCKFYNATLNYENNLKGLFGHFSNNNCVHLLCDTPQYLRDMELVKDTFTGNRSKGTRTTSEISKVGKTLQREWQLSKHSYLDENEEEQVYLNYEKIRSIGYIEECIAWNPDGNFDRVSAMDMVMIYRQDILKMSINHKEDDYINLNTGDDFIDKNWNKYISGSTQSMDGF